MENEELAQETPAPEEASEVPAPEPEVEPDEPIDNRERSRLGRRFTQLESELRSTKETLARMEQMLASPQSLPSAPLDDEYDSDKILTVGELEKYERAKQEKRDRQQSVYRSQYVQTIKSLSTDPDLHAEIEKEMLTNISEYPTHTNHQNPVHDAKVNYRLARAAVIEKKYAVPKPNVRGGVNAPTGVTATTRTATPPRKIVKLDEATAKFAKAMGLDEESEFVQQSVTRSDL